MTVKSVEVLNRFNDPRITIQRAMNDLLKNPGFTVVAVLNCAKGLLSSQHTANLAVLQPHVDNDIPAAAMPPSTIKQHALQARGASCSRPIANRKSGIADP
jgi:hypothetical protein